MAKTRTVYRDKKTGKFASKSAWKRSKAKGGTRYVRQQVKHKKAPRPSPVEAPSRPVFEWIVSFTYEASGRSFDVIVTARDEGEAYRVARGFLRDDIQGQRVVAAGFHGWKTDIAKGERSNEEAGEAEYRSMSRRSRRSKK